VAVLTADARETQLPKPKEEWVEVRTANFTIFSNAPEKMTRKAGANLEQLRSVLRTLFGGMNFLSPVPTYIFVFDDPKSFAPYTLYYQGRAKEQLGGYFGSGRFANHVAIVAHQYSKDVSSTVYHEYLHYILNTNRPGLPLWLNEGLAEFYSTFFIEDGVAKIGYPVGNHLAWLLEHPLIPIAELIAIDKDSPDYNEGVRRGAFYAQSWALTHMLILGEADGRARTAAYTGLLEQGVDRDEAFLKAFETSHKGLEEKLRKYIRSKKFGYANVPITEAAHDASTLTPMTYPDVLFRLGSLLTALGSERHAAAAEHFRTALEFDPNHGPSIAGLGRLDELAGRHDEALSRYRRAVELAPDDPMAHFHLGNLLCSDIAGAGSPGEKAALARSARAALKRAVVLRPSFGEAWAMLGTTYSWDQTETEMGIKALEHAQRLLPKRGDVGYNLAALYISRGRPEEAMTVIARMKAAGIDDGAVQAAEKLLPSEDPEPAQDATATVVEAVPTSTGRTSGFTERYNEAVGLVNAGKLKAAITMLEGLADGELTDGEAASTRALLVEVRAFSSFKARADEAVKLANAGEIDSAIAILEPLVDDAPDEVQTSEVRRMLGQLHDYRDFQEGYNRAVDLVNDGDFGAAAEILGPLVDKAPTPQLADMASTLLAELEEMR
jgi:tetratricopeptide (TPR) repeat protein